MTRNATLILSLAAALGSRCEGGAEPARDRPAQDRGPLVESVPSPLKSCAPEPRPRVSVTSVPGAPVQLELVRAYHVCLGEYVVLLRITGRSPRPVTQLVLERRWWDVHGQRPPRRDREVVTRLIERGTVRYLRIRWREGVTNRGERGLELRLRRAFHAEGAPFEAGPWAPGPPPRGVPRPAAGLSDKLQKVRDKVQGATDKVKALHRRLAAHPLVRHRPPPPGDAGTPKTTGGN